MPVPDYPNTILPFVDGTVISSEDMYTLFDNDTQQLKSLSTINGLLDEGSIASSFLVDFTYTQRGSHVDCEGSAGTAALDYIPDLVFSGATAYINESVDVVDTTPFRAIPGGGRTFYMPWDGSVLVTWQIFWTSMSTAPSRESCVFLSFDNEAEPASPRNQGQVKYADDVLGYQKARSYSGHTWVECSAGWHDVALCIVSDSRNHLNRVHSVNIHLMTFKTGPAL